MTNLAQTANYLLNLRGEKNRDLSQKPADIAAVHALTQAAVNVELFTIPLYMTAMYSIEGLHQINGANALYQGRVWPGSSTSANPQTKNEESFNLIFSVFIQEMLHLELAANICTALNKNAEGVANTFDPTFTSALLQGSYQADQVDYPNAWLCYGPENTKIPHIVDLTDFKDGVTLGGVDLALNQVKVNVEALNKNSISLFMAIEASHEVIYEGLAPDKRANYFPAVPFANWTEHSTEVDLPDFGSIAHMYSCLAKYLNFEYADGSTLFSAVFNPDSAQQDLFNVSDRKGGHGASGHPCAEFSGMGNLTVTAADPTTAKEQIFNMISGITDQGEGDMLTVKPTPVNDGLNLLRSAPADLELAGEVETRYQPDRFALEADYPSYNDQGERLPESADAHARYTGGELDHFKRFEDVAVYMNDGLISTWADWHANPDNKWTAELLTTPDYQPDPASKIPKPEDVATALNNLKATDGDANYLTFSHIAAGSIAGITTVLNDYWNYRDFIGKAGPLKPGCTPTPADPYGCYEDSTPTAFPYPSMGGSGDRISICWAIFGKAPELYKGAFPRQKGGSPAQGTGPANHACQGMSFNGDSDANACATKGVFHTCKGSNSCAGEGGCGFVHDAFGGGNCSSSGTNTSKGALFSAPADNQCGGKGGCAVPISASQLFAESGTMQLFDLKNKTDGNYNQLNTLEYQQGEPVYSVAWRAYNEALKGESIADGEMPEAPAPSDLRLAFPPST